jgi:histidinol-phosphate aminotransferase
LGYRPVPSEANFVFITVGPEAQALSEELLQLGVIVRPLGWMGFPEAMRISVGTAEENEKCLAAMAQAILRRATNGELARR